MVHHGVEFLLILRTHFLRRVAVNEDAEPVPQFADEFVQVDAVGKQGRAGVAVPAVDVDFLDDIGEMGVQGWFPADNAHMVFRRPRQPGQGPPQLIHGNVPLFFANHVVREAVGAFQVAEISDSNVCHWVIPPYFVPPKSRLHPLPGPQRQRPPRGRRALR